MPKMRASFQSLVRLLAQSLYPELDVFIRERIEVYTRKPMATQAWRWVNHGGEDYALDALPANAQPPGTRVVVTLAPDRTDFLDGRRIRQTARRYADFLPFPILLNGFGPINAVNASWHEPGWRAPSERERLLRAFNSKTYCNWYNFWVSA
ncbi:MAG: hypothetical protein RKO66_00375 [Candidatus Contendobacter sp.]|nr:hypothetical protein [Candidatus Contendobacter sp.]MDS4057581.1 hypothetical protein [Candidatus Contendobacter sp.]